MQNRSNTGVIILAAGNSSRMGRPKQLLAYNGKTFIGHVVDEAKKATLYPVIVVTGSQDLNIHFILNQGEIEIVLNTHWEEGMGSSIRIGLEKMLSINPAVEDVIISVCDQPYLSAQIFNDLIDKKMKSAKKIIASSYENVFGTPVLFNKTYFDRLLLLEGDKGARKLLELYKEDVGTIAFPKGDIDIDTENDYRKLIDAGQRDKS